MKLLIIGHGRHGKDTVAEILRDYHGLSFRSSSHWCAEHVIYPKAKEEGFAGDWKWLYNCRHKNFPSSFWEGKFCGREFWYNSILEYNKTYGGAAVARELLKEVDVYVGMRSRYEFDSAMKEGLFDHVIWVDRSEHLPPEGSESMELDSGDSNLIVDNNKGLKELWLNTYDLVEYINKQENK